MLQFIKRLLCSHSREKLVKEEGVGQDPTYPSLKKRGILIYHVCLECGRRKFITTESFPTGRFSPK